MITASVVTYMTSKEEVTCVVDCLIGNSINKIFIVDNSPEDNSLRAISTFYDVVYIAGHGNIGYGAGHNIAIKKAIEMGSEYHLIINPDISFADNVLREIVGYMDEHSNIGLIMPQIINPVGKIQRLCKLLPTPIDLIGRRFIPFKRIVERRNIRYEMQESGYDKIIDVPFLSGCFMFCRTEALKKVNGFSDRYWMYCEDIDICRRIGDHYRTVYYPFVSVTHTHKKESFHNRKMLRAHIASAIKYFNHWGWIFDKKRRIINQNAMRQYAK